jgi:protochlorophyllide reductase
VVADDYWGPDGFNGQRGHPTRADRSARARNVDDAARLWFASERATGVTYDFG